MTRALLVYLFSIWTCFSSVLIAQEDCNTDLGSIKQENNTCEPCINGMQKLLVPIQDFEQARKRMNDLNEIAKQELQEQQREIDKLVDKQDEIDRKLREVWPLKELIQSADYGNDEDALYLEHHIKRMKEFAERFPENDKWFDHWIDQFESFLELFNQLKELDQQRDALMDKITLGSCGDLTKLKLDCCEPGFVQGRYEDGKIDLDCYINALKELNEEYYDYRSSMLDQLGALVNLLKEKLKERAGEEKQATEKRDAFKDGLSGFLMKKVAGQLSTGLIQNLLAQGYELSLDQKAALESYAEAISEQMEVADEVGLDEFAMGGGVSGVGGQLVNTILENALADIPEHDRELISMISGEAVSQTAGHLLSGLLSKASPVMKYFLGGLEGAAGLGIMLVDRLWAVPLYLWEDKNLKILQGAFDHIMIGLVQAINLAIDRSQHIPYGPLNIYLEAIESETLPNGTSRKRAITICLPEDKNHYHGLDDLKDAVADAMSPPIASLDIFDRFERKEHGDQDYLEFQYDSKIRFKVRLGCYCGDDSPEKIYTSEPDGIQIKPDKITSTGETFGVIAEATVTNPTGETITYIIHSGLIPSDGVHQPYVIIYPIRKEIPPGETIVIEIDDSACARDDMPPVPEGEPLIDIDEWILVPPRYPEMTFTLSEPIDIVESPREAAPIVVAEARVIVEFVDDIDIEDLPKNPLSNDPVKLKETMKGQGIWNELSKLEGRGDRKEDFKENATQQLEEQLGQPVENLPEEAQKQFDEGLEQIWSAIEFVGTEAKTMAKERIKDQNPDQIKPAVVGESIPIPVLEEEDHLLNPSEIEQVEESRSVDHCRCIISERDNIYWPRYSFLQTGEQLYNGDTINWGIPVRSKKGFEKSKIKIIAPEIRLFEECPDNCNSFDTIRYKVDFIDMNGDSSLIEHWNRSDNVIELPGRGKLVVTSFYVCSCGQDVRQGWNKDFIVITEPNDCCDELRNFSHQLVFQLDDGVIKIDNNQLYFKIAASERNVSLDFNLEALFCHLKENQIFNLYDQSAESNLNQSQLQEIYLSGNISVSHNSHPSSGRPYFNIEYSEVVDGKEYFFSIVLDEEACVFDAATLIDNQYKEHLGPPIYEPEGLIGQINLEFVKWRAEHNYVDTGGGDEGYGENVLAPFLRKMMHLYLQIIKSDGDPSYLTAKSNWKAKMIWALNIEINNNRISSTNRKSLSQLLELVKDNSTSDEAMVESMIKISIE
ncbi:MAG: hypothetical protein R3275_07355 [Saprospiraceae bacterium]|nr:hypothetical protein [Saprospiraceae bacterium]